MMDENELSHYIYALYCNDRIMNDDDPMSYENFTDDLRYEQVIYLLGAYAPNLIKLFNSYYNDSE